MARDFRQFHVESRDREEGPMLSCSITEDWCSLWISYVVPANFKPIRRLKVEDDFLAYFAENGTKTSWFPSLLITYARWTSFRVTLLCYLSYWLEFLGSVALFPECKETRLYNIFQKNIMPKQDPQILLHSPLDSSINNVLATGQFSC